jgi:ABC-type transport system substrate-binding protein
MWAMKSYTIEPWTYDVFEPGQKVTVTLRSGIHWHDGDPVTSADIKWNYDFIMNASFNRYSDILLTYDHTEIIDDTHFTIYIKCTGIWTVYIYFGSALLFPQKIWEPWLGDPAGAASWTPWTVNYDVWTGETGHGDLTCLIGTGAWVFVEWDQPGGAAYLVANRPDAVWTGNPGYWAGVHVGSEVKGMMREDIDFSGRIDMIDMWTAQKAFGAVPGNPRWHYGRGDTDASSRIDMVDMWRIQKRFGKITLPA